MPILLVVFVALYLITFAHSPTMGAGWAWDTGNALGFAAIAGMLYVALPTDFRRYGRNHEMLGYAVLAVSLAHVFWFLLSDGAATEFIKPGAPLYMWTGIASIVLVFALVTLAMLPHRWKKHSNYQAFKYWHQVITVLAMATAIHHVAGSNFYLSTWYQKSLLIVLAIVVILGRSIWQVLRSRTRVSPFAFLTMSAATAILFAALRNYV